MLTKLIALYLLPVFISSSLIGQEKESSNKRQICFTENLGQVTDQNYNPRPDVLFSGCNNNLVYHLRNNGISYQLNKVSSWTEMKDPKTKEKVKVVEQISISRLDIHWIGINPSFKIIKGESTGDYENYYSSACPNGVTNVKTYKDITYKYIYENIDLHYYEKQGTLKYDYIIMPGANYKNIQMQIEGSDKIVIKKNGSVNFETPNGTINEAAPLVFQSNKKLKAKWVLKNNLLSFDIENYNPLLPLVIDPAVRVWGTFYGGTNGEGFTAIKTDSIGNTYLSGHSQSNTTNFVATTGSHQSVFGGNIDGLLVKFNASGVRQWATYYGGASWDWATSCKLDNAGNIFLVGYSNSLTGISTPGSHQPNLYGTVYYDGFLVKFNNNGIRQWGTYYGDNGSDQIFDCTTDLIGNVYVVGQAYPGSSLNGITTTGVYQVNGGGGSTDGFMAKFNSAGVRQWGTYYGGTANDVINSCVFDGSSYIYLAGTTSSPSSTVIATPSSHQPTLGGGDDAFIAKFNLNGARAWGSYYGGIGNEEGFGCTIDNSGNFYLTGNTSSSVSAIATAGSHQANYGGGPLDGYLAQFNTAGVRQWATYYGGTGDDEIYGCNVDITGNVYLAGYSNGGLINSISTVGSHQYFYAGGLSDAFLVKLNSNGVRQWGTYYGAYNDDYGYCTTVDIGGFIYFAGQTNSNITTQIATVGSHQPNLGSPGLPDGFLVKFKECPLVTSTVTTQSNLLCYGANNGSASVMASGDPSYTYSWIPSGGNSSSASGLAAQTYSCMVTGLCGGVSNQTIIITQPSAISSTLSATSTTVCKNTSVAFSALATGGSGVLSYSWSSGATTSLSTITASNNATFSVSITDTNNCTVNNTISLTVKPLPIIHLSTSDSAICIGESAFLSQYGADSYTWSTGYTANGYYITPTVTTSYTLTGTGTNGCKNSLVYTQIVDPCIAIKENKLKNPEINIYPNPVKEFVIIESSGLSENNKIEIYNSLGQIIFQERLYGEKNIFYLNKIDKGIYFLRIKTNNSYFDYKIVKE